MSGLINKIKDKATGHSHSDSTQNPGEQPSFSIQPHPAKSNDPKDVEGPQLGGGLNSNPELGAFHARDPYVPSKEIANNIEPPLSREELRARSAQLNANQK